MLVVPKIYSKHFGFFLKSLYPAISSASHDPWLGPGRTDLQISEFEPPELTEWFRVVLEVRNHRGRPWEASGHNGTPS